ncbi:class I SAM-dependent methyltransferase [Rubricoccus marinus]|uniref:Methyltransferase type 12 domain-containing protein n=1 Tax=Rubricoccus marinus TaxID=716817 RepID=A0A259TYN6_9BACT|nr:class I SAM-dependent methyltransferase [Rubricoccus marinus]OZC02859.1 hypothetical protein BSZ36_07660 [Rubricoccus marinus]
MSTDVSHLASGQTGRDYYADLYQNDLEREAEWLRRTAPQKVEAVRELLSRRSLRPETVLEIGSGTGAVIGALRERGVGRDHYAVDFSPEAIAALQRAEPDIHAAVADITASPDPFGVGAYDLGLASHVIEHLEEPRQFLTALRSVPIQHFIAEVPLENLPGGKLKAQFKDRSTNAAGHVQFFDRRSFVALLERSGWRVEDVVTYAPMLDADTFAFAHGAAGAKTRLIKRLTEQALPRFLGGVWTSLYHAHCAALCTKA